MTSMDLEGGGGGGGGGGQGVWTPLKNHKGKGFLSNVGMDPLEFTKPAINVEPSSLMCWLVYNHNVTCLAY